MPQTTPTAIAMVWFCELELWLPPPLDVGAAVPPERKEVTVTGLEFGGEDEGVVKKEEVGDGADDTSPTSTTV